MVNLYLHEHSNFSDLINILARDKKIDPSLIEKDYWIMHCLYGLQKCGLSFKLKGGTSLSKAYGIIHRFSEDIDLQLDPPAGMDVKAGKYHDKLAHRESRKRFYDWLAEDGIAIEGIHSIKRDYAFDDTRNYRSGGIRLYYETVTEALQGVKEGILLEAGFDTVSPNSPVTISSWAYNKAVEAGVPIKDNRAINVACYHPGYTFVEKLQAISTKYRNFCEGSPLPANFLRHYYDVYCLLDNDEVQAFIGSDDYHAHKAIRFPQADNQNIADNEAFILSNDDHREELTKSFMNSTNLYYQGQPALEDLLKRIDDHKDTL